MRYTSVTDALLAGTCSRSTLGFLKVCADFVQMVWARVAGAATWPRPWKESQGRSPRSLRLRPCHYITCLNSLYTSLTYTWCSGGMSVLHGDSATSHYIHPHVLFNYLLQFLLLHDDFLLMCQRSHDSFVWAAVVSNWLQWEPAAKEENTFSIFN